MLKSEAQALLRIAWRDHDTAQLLAGAEAPEPSWGFHVQQAIEKGLKAWILLMDGSPPMTHDLADLLELLHYLGVDVDRFRCFSRFTVFAVQLRYDDEPSFLNLNRQAWLVEVASLLKSVSDLIER